MKKLNFLEASKLNWISMAEQISDSQLQIGCLQRIAIAIESINSYKGKYEKEQLKNKRLRREIAKFRGKK